MAGTPPPDSSSRRAPLLLLVIVVPLLLGLVVLLRSGGGLRVDPGIDWSAYPSAAHDAIDLAAKNADCAALAARRAEALAGAWPSTDPGPVVAYIDTVRQQLVCPR